MRFASLKSAALILWLTMTAVAQVTLVAPDKAALDNASPDKASPAKPAPEPRSDGPLLPVAFSGWQKAPGPRIGTDPAQADPTQAALLKETGLVAYERARYTRQGRNLEIKAFRFTDATGALAAYSALQNGPLAAEKFCERAGSSGNRALLACTNVVVDIIFDKVTPMAPAELRSLAAQLSPATGHAAIAPSAPLYLPKLPADVLSNVRLALGPAGLPHTNTPLPAAIIDFSKGAEVVTADLATDDGAALLTIVRYPTFALATDRQKAFDDWAKSRPTVPATPDQPRATFYTRRIGPLVAVVSGNIAEPAARTVAEQIPYDVEVTQNEPVYNPKENIGNLVVNMLYLSFIIIGFTFVTGVAFGGVRILAHKFFPGRFFDRPENVEFIKLDLRD